jgi:hypothetical protein
LFGGGLGFCRRSSYSQIFLGCNRKRSLRAGDHQNFLELVQVCCWSKLNECVRLMVRINFDGLYGANRKASRINLISTRTEYFLPRLDAVVRGEIVDKNLAGRAATKDGPDTGSSE